MCLLTVKNAVLYFKDCISTQVVYQNRCMRGLEIFINL